MKNPLPCIPCISWLKIGAFALILLPGCSKPPAPVKWEYEVITVENTEHWYWQMSYHEMETNSAGALEHMRANKADAGGFSLDFATKDYGADIRAEGRDGWELVSAVPQLETVPDAEYDAGDTYNADTGKFTPRRLPFANVRTGKVILIFKRPSQK